ncbi:MAG: hypothetical protein H5T96_06165 [Tissierellales bacterium]|nr:hypothetical protein [Tissierellales bacterium]
MLGGFLIGIFVAWILSFFGVDSMIIQGLYELFNIEITSAGYYTLFALIGLVGGAIKNK